MNKTYNSDGTTVRVFDGYSYEYDKQNRISAIKQLDVLGAESEMYSYEYDKLGQLVRYNDKVANKSYAYTYDNNGNILTKSEYAYTTGALGVATDTTTYSYEADWADKLTKVDGQEISYDSIGNPISYLGATLIWQGRQLTSYSNDDYTLNYEYDENGMRYRTTVLDKEANQETVYEYVWADGKLISLVYFIDEAQCTAKYLYNEFDEPVGMIYTDESNFTTTLYYLKNAQGDITCIVDSSGEKYISFSYDAFGKVTTQYHLKNSLSTPLGMVERILKQAVRRLAVFGYRGYCYDTFTELYYLQSRYYDPNTGRFINADDTNYLNATGTVLGCNLFAYCENDPVNRVDESGNFGTPIQWALAIVGGIVGWILGDYVAKYFGYRSGWKYWAIRTGVVIGGAVVGWFAGAKLAKAVTKFLVKHPSVAAKLPSQVKWMFGIKNPWASTSFQSAAKLSQHFAKHASEWGGKFKTVNQYLKGARNLLKSSVKGIYEFTSKDGWFFKYNSIKNEFICISNKGTISSFFKPVSGILYWYEQVKKYK